jgi:uncharacterized Zn finger protein (UPF0148 family)
MKTIYRRDASGAVYAWGGVFGLSRTLDERREQAVDVEHMLARRLPEILQPRPRQSVGSRIREQVRLGWRADPVTGQIMCPECEKMSRPDVEHCGNCGNPLLPLEEYTGAKDGDTVKCATCSRLNPPSNNNCTGCGEPMPASVASASSRPRRSSSGARFQHPHSTPSPAVYPAPSGTAHEGYRSRGFLVARETFDAIDPTTHKVVHVLAGRTNVASGHWLVKMRPDAFQYAA